MRNTILTIAIFASLLNSLLFSEAGATSQLQLELRETVSIADDHFILEDLVSSHSGREDFWQAIRSEELGPVTSQPVMLNPDNVLGLLAARGYDWRLIDLRGATRIQIVHSGNTISARDIVELVVSGCSEALGVKVELLELPEHPIMDQQFLAGLPEMQLRWPGETTSCLPDAVEFTLDGRLDRILLLHQYAKFRLPVVTALVDLQHGDILLPDQLECRITDCRAGSLVLTELQQAIGMEASRHILSGDQMAKSSLVQPWTVKRNATVQLLTSSAGLSCSAEGQAMDSGHVGDRISVKRSQDGQTFMGVINSEGQVVIE